MLFATIGPKNVMEGITQSSVVQHTCIYCGYEFSAMDAADVYCTELCMIEHDAETNGAAASPR